jgi:hypothetical protein
MLHPLLQKNKNQITYNDKKKGINVESSVFLKSQK